MPTNPKDAEPFSQQLEAWLKSDKPKTVASLNEVFAEKSLAIIIMVLMFLPALPVPTGGVSHLFEVVSMLLALQLIVGRRNIWLPKSWSNKKIRGIGEKKAIKFIIKCVRWFERFARPRMSYLIQKGGGLIFLGFFIFIYSLVAFLSPPFSGLDTLPSMGVVVIALSMVLEDFAITIAGILIGAAGTALIVGAGAALIDIFKTVI